MSESGPVLGEQLKHLLAVVEQHRSERCQEVLDQAHEQARQLIKKGYRYERQRMHKKLDEARQKLRRQMVSLAARRQTRQRQQRQQEDEDLLMTCWQSLREALLKCWQQPALRQQWVDDLVAQAAAALVDTRWLIEHPLDWRAEERAALRLRLEKQLGQAPQFKPCSAMAAGLRIDTEGACVDGSVDGLLRARAAIDAMLLARINEQRASGG